MPNTYKLAATPSLFSEGQFKDELKAVTFTATSPRDTRHWLTINCGQFRRSFATLISADIASKLVAALVRGDRVEFPGEYPEEQFEGGFAYVHHGNSVVL
jgi:hypothetical protein